MKRVKYWVKNTRFLFCIVICCVFLFDNAYLYAFWTSGGPPGGHVNSLAMSANPDVIYAATDQGVYKTADGGTTWNKTGYPNINARAVHVAPPPLQSQLIHFDNITAPCIFNATTALTDEYSALGVIFSGPGGNDGGAILDECSSFTPSGYSAPNFLAFDSSESLMDGGTAQGPETLIFSPPVNYVGIKAAWNHIGITMDAYDGEDNLIDSDSRNAFSGFVPMSVSGSSIAKVVIGYYDFGSVPKLLLDDLQFGIQQSSQHPDVVWVGTDDGIYISMDGGDTWTQKGLAGARINAIAINPNNPDIIFAGTGKPDEEGDVVGIFKSTDGGNNWSLRYSTDLDAVVSLLIDIETHNTVYAGAYPAGDGDDCLFKSINGGRTWQTKQIGPFTASRQTVVALAMHATSGPYPDTIYAIRSGHSVDNDIFKSVDKGETWTATDAPNISLNPPWALAIDPNDPSIVYAGTASFQEQLYKYANGNWSAKANGLPRGNPTSILIDPQNSHIYVGLLVGGIYKSVDAAENWQISSQGLTMTTIEDLAIDPITPDTLYATIPSNGYNLAVTTNGGTSWDYLYNSPTYLDAVTIDPQDPATIFVGDGLRPQSSLYVYKSINSGQTWTGTRLFSLISSTLLSVADIWIDPSDSNIIVVAVKGGTDTVGVHGGGIYRSTNGGDSYQRVYPSLGTMSATSLAFNPLNPQSLYCGTTSQGYVYKSSNGGISWSLFSPGGNWVGWVSDIVVEANGHVYVATDEGVMKWDGVGWTNLTGLPTNDITALAIDRSTNSSAVYAGTEGFGVYVSKDEGITWVPYVEGLGDFNIETLAFGIGDNKKKLYAGTDAKGVWKRETPEYLNGVILWNQPVTPANTGAYACQDFEVASDGFDIFLADDFINPEAWKIETIYVPGNLWDRGRTLMSASALHFEIYADAAGVPDGDPYMQGNLPIWQLSVPPSDPQVILSNGILKSLPSDVTLNLDSPFILSPGTYWLVFYPELDYASAGQYGRHVSITVNGYDSQVINPGGAFGMPTEWISIRDASAWSIAEQDLAFILVGEAAACEGDFEPDGDVDGSDLAAYIENSMGISPEDFAADFGKNDCL